MKTPILVLASLLTVASAQANCPHIAGAYAVTAQPFNGNEAGPYGKTRIAAVAETNSACIYSLQSNVKVYADPIKTGTQTLTVAKARGPAGNAFTLSGNGTSAKGLFFVGASQLTLEVKLTGCGGEGSKGSSCGVDIFLR